MSVTANSVPMADTTMRGMPDGTGDARVSQA
jgi:hypothetical protein